MKTSYKKVIAYFLFFVNNNWVVAGSFENILLVINYNFPHYESVEFIQELYKPYFPNVVFYGPSAEKNYLVHSCEHNDGFLSYTALADAMMRYPEFDGYLFCHDDCLMNPWRFTRYDQKKIWFPVIGFYKKPNGNPDNIEKGLAAFPNWCWWQSEWGCSQMQKSYADTPARYKEMLSRNWGKSNVVAAYSDIMYIPKEYADDFIFLSHIFGKMNRSFLETALPTIVSCLSPKESWEYLVGFGTNRLNDKPNYELDADFCHPLKLSYPLCRSYISSIFADMEEKMNKNS